MVVGGGSGEVHPRGEIPLGPRLMRKDTTWVLGLHQVLLPVHITCAKPVSVTRGGMEKK